MIALGVPRSLHCHLEALSSIPCLCSGWGSGQRLDGWCESWLPLICVSLCSDVVDSEIIPIILGHSISLMIRTKAAPFPLVSAPFHVCVISLSHLVICVIICAIILRYFSLNIRRLSFFGWRFLVPSKYIVWIKIWFYMLKAIHWYVYSTRPIAISRVLKEKYSNTSKLYIKLVFMLANRQACLLDNLLAGQFACRSICLLVNFFAC